RSAAGEGLRHVTLGYFGGGSKQTPLLQFPLQQSLSVAHVPPPGEQSQTWALVVPDLPLQPSAVLVHPAPNVPPAPDSHRKRPAPHRRRPSLTCLHTPKQQSALPRAGLHPVPELPLQQVPTRPLPALMSAPSLPHLLPKHCSPFVQGAPMLACLHRPSGSHFPPQHWASLLQFSRGNPQQTDTLSTVVAQVGGDQADDVHPPPPAT